MLVAIYLLALAPFYAAVNGSAERVAKKEGDLAWMRSVGGEVLALSASAPSAAAPTGESLVVLIDRAARECGLGSSLTGQTPSGENGIRVRLEQAEFDKLIVCLGSLQQAHSVDHRIRHHRSHRQARLRQRQPGARRAPADRAA